jgi:glucokinase
MTPQQPQAYFLAGDIGGTKTTLALYDPQRGPLAPLSQTTVQNASASGLEEIVETFLAEQKIRPVSACFGVAGPVSRNRVRMTNLDWTLDGTELQQRFDMKSVTVINDLVATAMGAVQLPPERLHTVNQGRPDSEGTIAVIAPGTGLGEAFLVNCCGRTLPFPSEGGHSSFAPVNELQTGLLAYMLKEREHVSAEQVCSGIGIPHLFDFLHARRREERQAPGLRVAGDRTRAVVEAALDARKKEGGPTNTAVRAIELFADLLAAEGANLVLKVLATGGLYIGGGLAPRILPFLERERFMSFFCRGVHSDMLAHIPVRVILEPKTALIGAAACCLDGLDPSGGQ